VALLARLPRPSPLASSERQALRALLGVLLIIALVWQLPYGRWILYPFSLLATSAHELGHGLTALFVGGEFRSFVLHADGSGAALWAGSAGRGQRALVAAGGLLGPSVVGSALIIAARSPRLARWASGVLAAGLVVVVIVWARNVFGALFLGAAALAFAAVTVWLDDRGVTFAVRLTGALLCLSWLQDVNYMFATHANVGGMRQPSDTAVMADALWLPFWFWGGVIALLSLAVLTLGLWLATRPQRSR